MCEFFLRRLKLVFISLVLWLPASAKRLLAVKVEKSAPPLSSVVAIGRRLTVATSYGARSPEKATIANPLVR
jgi:hypothetical protein